MFLGDNMNEEVKKHIKEKLALVPSLPGSYQMKNKDGMIIYVGKAKNLKNRLKSYFTGTVTGKTAMLVHDIATFEYIVTSSELESLILEITLIKKYNPRYNILLKDDKSYPYIELTNDKYPTVKVVRNVNRKRNKNRLFGPFPNVTAARRTVEIINRMYPLRKCATLKKDVCLYYHLGECLGYCKHQEIDEKRIQKMKEEITSFLKGDASIITEKIKKDMYKASESLNFEKASELKSMLDDITITLKRQKIDLNRKYNFDMFAFFKNNNYLSIQVFFIRDGLLFGRHKDIFTIVEEEQEEVLEYIIKFYEKDHLLPNEMIVVSEEIDKELLEEYLNVKVLNPKKGDIKKLLSLATDNAKVALQEEEEILKRNDDARVKAKEELEQALHIPNITRIEAFDNSHLFGTFYVGGMVVFDDFLPNKDLYRKYKISMNVKDDLGAMREVLYRRYYKVLMEEDTAPDLIVIDGGELQINVACEVLDSLGLKIPIIGLKKDDRHRTNTIIDRELNIIPIDSKSNLFLFLTKIQDEVHRYAIHYHRNIKSKGMLSSILDFVPGIGEKRKKGLLKKFGSLKRMKEASLEELEAVLNKDVAKNLYQYLKDLEN